MGPLISPERLKTQTSNFAWGLKVRDTKPQNEKYVKKGRGLSHVTYFSNSGISPNISGTAEDTNQSQILHADGKLGVLNKK